MEPRLISSFTIRSSHQNIEITEDGHGHLVLLLNGAQQFHAFDEHRYHEAFAIVPWLYHRQPLEHAVVLGGGDGLLASRLLAIDGVHRVTVVEIDDYVVDLARHHPGLRSLNNGAFWDERVTVVEADATEWIRECPAASLDALFVDFPDALHASLEVLYGEPFYANCRHALRPGGLLTSQVKFTPRYFSSVHDRLRRVFGHVLAFHAVVPTHVIAGFVMASTDSLQRVAPIPGWTRSLDEQVLAGMLRLPTDLAAYLAAPTPPLSLHEAALADAAFFRALAPRRLGVSG